VQQHVVYRQNIDGSFVGGLDAADHRPPRGVAGTSDNARVRGAAGRAAFEDIHLTGTGTLFGTDDSTATVNIPFAFSLYGRLHDDRLRTNGLITLGGTDGAHSPTGT